jgi:hypothetical protein
MIEITAQGFRDVQRKLGRYSPKAPVVISRSLNRTASSTKTIVNREARKIYVIKAKDINQALGLRKASRSNLLAVLKYSGERIPLDKFKFSPKNPRPKKPPQALKVQVKKDGYKNLLHAFVANIQGNKIFERAGKSRLPIKRLFGPAVPQMVDNADLRQFVEQEQVRIYENRLDHEIKRVLEGGGS